MPVCNLSEFTSSYAKGKSLLGLDPGRTVIGVAISDPGWMVASPLTGITRSKFTKDAALLAEIISQRNIGGIIVGLPRNMDGSEGPSAQSARTFVSNLSKPGILPVAALPFAFWDERLSTAAIERFMISDNMSRKRREETIDKAAAAYILQGACDALRNLRQTQP